MILDIDRIFSADDLAFGQSGLAEPAGAVAP